MNIIAKVGPEDGTHRSSENVIGERLVEGRREMLAYFRRRLGTWEDAEDALQDMCLKAIRAARTLRHEEKVDAWLGRVMRHTLVDHYRRRASRKHGEEAFAREVLAQVSVSEPANHTGPCLCVRHAVAELPPDKAALIRRVDLCQEARGRVAADLGVTENALAVRLHRARKALEKRIAALCPTCAAGGYAECDCAALRAAGTRVAA